MPPSEIECKTCREGGGDDGGSGGDLVYLIDSIANGGEEDSSDPVRLRLALDDRDRIDRISNRPRYGVNALVSLGVLVNIELRLSSVNGVMWTLSRRPCSLSFLTLLLHNQNRIHKPMTIKPPIAAPAMAATGTGRLPSTLPSLSDVVFPDDWSEVPPDSAALLVADVELVVATKPRLSMLLLGSTVCVTISVLVVTPNGGIPLGRPGNDVQGGRKGGPEPPPDAIMKLEFSTEMILSLD